MPIGTRIRKFEGRLFQHEVGNFLVDFDIFLSWMFECSNLKKPSSPDKKKAQLYFDQGTAELVNKRYTQALEYLLKAQELNPDDTRIFNNLGMSYYFKGKREKALTYLKRSVELDKRNSDARNNLAGIFWNRGIGKPLDGNTKRF